MPSNVEVVQSAIIKAMAEQDKLIKEWKAAKTAPEKEKLKKMAEGAKKIASAFYDQLPAAALKDKAAMWKKFGEMGIPV